MKKAFIVIVNFNNKRDILRCLYSLRYERAEIIVVDNKSSDDSIEAIKSKFKQVKILENEKNIGFAAASNKGIEYALRKKADYVLLLNPDTIVEKNFLSSLLKKKADIISPVIKFKRQGEWVYDFGGRVNFLIGRTTHLEKSVLSKRTNLVDYVSGCCMLIKKEVFEKMGFLDERYFMFFEDVDFCLRAKKSDFKIKVDSSVTIFHNLSEGREKSLKCHLWMLKSNFIFINKWLKFYKKPLAYFYLFLLWVKILVNK